MIKDLLSHSKRTQYVLSQPWAQTLERRYPEAHWCVTAEGHLEGHINLGYVSETEYGLPFRDWAKYVDSDSYIIDHDIFRRNVGDINITLRLTGYVKYTADELQLLRDLGKVHRVMPQAYDTVYCER